MPRRMSTLPTMSSDTLGYSSGLILTREHLLTYPVIARAIDIITGVASAARIKGIDSIDPRCGESGFIADAVADMVFDGYTAVSYSTLTGTLWSEPQEAVEICGYTPTSGWKQLSDIEGLFIVRTPSSGLLTRGRRALERLENAYQVQRDRTKNPIPLVELHQNDDRQPLSAEKAQELVDGWSAARERPSNGAVAYTPSSIKLIPHGEQDLEQTRENVTAANTEMAVLLGVSASYLGLPVDSTGLTYSNPESRTRELLGSTVAPLLRYLEDGIKLATGLPVTIDTSAIGMGDLASRAAAYTAAIGAGILTPQRAAEIEAEVAL